MMGGTGQLSGKRALVTGASGGLGGHFAERLSAHGTEVILAARRVAALDTEVQELQCGGRISAMTPDVTDSALCAGLVEAARPIDTLINTAGVVRERPILTHSEQDGDGLLDTNLSVYFSSQRPLRQICRT